MTEDLTRDAAAATALSLVIERFSRIIVKLHPDRATAIDAELADLMGDLRQASRDYGRKDPPGAVMLTATAKNIEAIRARVPAWSEPGRMKP